MAKAPYPKHLESTATARDGTLIELRPVRPEDEPLLQDLVAHMSREDLRMRFFAPIRELTHAFAAHLVQIDYARDMAILAQHGGQTLGVARYFSEPDGWHAEYAVAVRTDWKRHGIGHLLMTRLIEVAREAGIGELVGQVLHENRSMLDLCHALGFTLAANPGDATITVVRKKLR